MSDKVTDLTIDIETLGTKPGSVILSIGALAFDRGAKNLENRLSKYDFYLKIDLEDCLKQGLTVDSSTLLWWFQRSKKVIESTFDFKGHEGYDLETALHQLNEYLTFVRSVNPSVKIWTNSPLFDIALLEQASRLAGRGELSWTYKDHMDLRTLRGLFPTLSKEAHELFKLSTDQAHNAYEDCVYQASVIQYMLQRINAV